MLRLLTLLLLAALLGGCASQADQARQDGLSIPMDSLTQEPSFIDWTQNDRPMQLIARKTAQGAIRLAFNTCQSCSGSPYAWFEYIGGGMLQCQNCGQTFNIEVVGTPRATGCNPVTITDFTVENGAVIVPAETLDAGASLFENWKVFD
ncbi:MAG: DUF2318 domain-containing protein [Clostridia bacterium]|nr:DUF2318 domain-containing protein [Clostridia bacterium]